MGTVLTVGKDINLLWTRSALLRQTGADVRSAHLNEAFALLESEPVDVVVLCHTLDEAEMAAIAQLARRENPAARILQLTVRVGDYSPPDIAAEEVATLKPELLVSKVTDLLAGLPRRPNRAQHKSSLVRPTET